MLVMGRFDNWHGKIIWSADGVSWPAIRKILEREDFPREEVAVKLDRLFLTTYGLSPICKIQDLGIPVFADAKIVEIPSKMMELVKLHLEQEPWMLNVMVQVTNTGVSPAMREAGITDDELDVLNDFAAECKKVGTKPCVVTVLTSKARDLVEWEYGTGVEEKVHDYVGLASSCGVTDIVCSPKEVEYLRGMENWTKALQFNTPGVRLPDSERDDQKRVMSPGEALAAGADRLIIGRDLSRNGDFAGNLAKIKADIEKHEGKKTA